MLSYWSLNCPYGWDDFGLAWSMLDQHIPISCTDRLVVYRNHKRKFRLAKQFSSGMAAVNFHWHQADQTYSFMRLSQATAFACALIGTYLLVLSLPLLLGSTGLLIDIVSLAIGYAVLSLCSLLKARDLRAVIFPALDLIHISLWVAGATYLLYKGMRSPSSLADMLQQAR